MTYSSLHKFLNLKGIACFIAVMSIFISASLFSSCSSVVDTTKQIKLSKSDLKAIEKTKEELFTQSLTGLPLKDWQKGKLFLAADDRTFLIFSRTSTAASRKMAGKRLYFSGTGTETDMSGNHNMIISFSDESGNTYDFDSGKSPASAEEEIISSSIPMLIDMSLVEKADSLLRGKKLWTRTALWYDAEGEKMKGKKFVEVYVDSVSPGDLVFPLKILFSDNNGTKGSFLMNLGNAPTESRSFANLFFLDNPRDRYPSVSDENWEYIQRGDIKKGMTKLECRLALGNPATVAPGHDYNRLLDYWSYPDGTYIWFQDDIVTNFRK